MYGYLVNAILIFLTHPAIIFPITEPGVGSGILQTAIVLICNIPSDRAPTVANATAIIYYIILGIWTYVKIRLALQKAVVLPRGK